MRMPGLLLLLSFLSTLVLGEGFSIRLAPGGGVELESESSPGRGLRLEWTVDGDEWIPYSDLFAGQRVFPIDIDAHPMGWFRVQRWELGLDPIVVVIIGGSTVAEFNVVFQHSGGWGEAFPQHFVPEMRVVNLALPGQSSRLYLGNERNLSNLAQIAPDFVLLHFGWMDGAPGVFVNDKAETSPELFVQNIHTLVREVRAFGGTPVLFTPVASMIYDERGNLVPYLSGHSQRIRELAEELDCSLVDLYRASFAEFAELGWEGTAEFRTGPKDQLHFNQVGAERVTEMVLPLLPHFLQGYRR